MGIDQSDPDSITLERTRQKTRKPRQFRVILHNDNYTSMDFVVDILEEVFNHPPAIASQIMMKIHREGFGVAGVYMKDIAETKVAQVEARAIADGFPLLCTLEQA